MEKGKTNRTINSAVWYTFSNLLSKAMLVILTPIFSRIITKAEYGKYTNFVAWQNVLVVVLSLELSSTVLRAKFDYEENKFSEYVFTILIFSILLPASIGISAFLLFGKHIEKLLSMDKISLMSLIIITMFYSVLQIFQAEQRAFVKYKISSAITLLFSMCSFGFPLILCRICKNKLYALICGSALTYLIFGIGFCIYYLIRVKHKTLKKEYIRYALIISLPIVPHIVSSVIMGNSDKVMITKMCGLEYSAIYGIVYTAALVITLLRNSLNNAWIPWFFQQMKEENYSRIKIISQNYMLLFAGITMGICFFGPEMIIILGGQKYIEASSIVPIIMLGCFYNFMNLFYVNIEFYEKKTAMISVVTITTALINIILNYYGIKYFGYEAAAVATAICNGLTVLFHYFVTIKMKNKIICDNRGIAVTCIAGILITIGFRFLYECDIIIRYGIFMGFIALVSFVAAKKVMVKKI